MSDHVCDTGHFDRTLCPEPCGRMHSFCATCGERQDPCDHDHTAPEPAFSCRHCDYRSDEYGDTHTHTAPEPADVDALRELLDLMVDFRDNDQRARYLLSSNWMRDRLAAQRADLTASGWVDPETHARSLDLLYDQGVSHGLEDAAARLADPNVIEAVLREHAYVPSGLRGVSRCACGLPFHGMPHDHRAHVAATVRDALTGGQS